MIHVISSFTSCEWLGEEVLILVFLPAFSQLIINNSLCTHLKMFRFWFCVSVFDWFDFSCKIKKFPSTIHGALDQMELRSANPAPFPPCLFPTLCPLQNVPSSPPPTPSLTSPPLSTLYEHWAADCRLNPYLTQWWCWAHGTACNCALWQCAPAMSQHAKNRIGRQFYPIQLWLSNKTYPIQASMTVSIITECSACPIDMAASVLEIG